MEATTTPLTTLPLSTRILIMEFAIFVKVEKMEDRIGSSVPCIWVDVVVGPPRGVFSRTARAMVCSMGPTARGFPRIQLRGPDELRIFP